MVDSELLAKHKGMMGGIELEVRVIILLIKWDFQLDFITVVLTKGQLFRGLGTIKRTIREGRVCFNGSRGMIKNFQGFSRLFADGSKCYAKYAQGLVIRRVDESTW